VVSRVETELRVAGEDAAFVVRTEEPDFRVALRELAYAEVDGEYVRRMPADAAGLRRIYRNFECRIQELLAHTARRRPAPWQPALEELVDRLDAADVGWFLIGSAALAVRGADVAPRDIDFVTVDHARTAVALDDALVEPPLADAGRSWVAAWFGRAYLGARVEWVADVYPDADDRAGPNEIGPAAAARLERVRWRNRDLLLAPLELQLAVTERRGLDDRVAAIHRLRQADVRR